MTRNSIIFLTVAAVLGLNATTVFAARSLSKSFKLSVTLPPSVQMASELDTGKITLVPKNGPQQVTEKIVTTADHQKILLRTTVVK